jgi:hypothetical protein
MFSRLLLVAGSILLGASPSLAQGLFNSSRAGGPGKSNASLVIAFADVDYEAENIDFEIERSIIGAEFAAGLFDQVDFYGQAGFIFDSDIDTAANLDGSGFIIGGGAKGLLYAEDKFRLLGSAGIDFIKESFDGIADYELDVSLFEFHLGATAGYAVTPKFMPYGGLELAIADGEADADGSAGDADLERDDALTVLLGANLLLSQFVLRAEVRVAGEQTFLLGGTMAL